MLESLLQIDYTLFNWINQSWTSGLGDVLFPLFREKLFWYPFYIGIICAIILLYKKKSYVILLSIIALVSIADQLSSHVLKPNIQRIRPCNQEILQAQVIVRAPCRQSFSFTSSHATNHFAVAFFLWFLFPNTKKSIRYLLFLWAGLISISQVYVGLHFPFDILGGGLLGAILGVLSGRIIRHYYLTKTSP